MIEEVIGVGGQDPYAYFQLGIEPELKSQVDDLIIQRSIAKQAKDFERADAIREELAMLDIAIMDTPQGTVWEKI